MFIFHAKYFHIVKILSYLMVYYMNGRLRTTHLHIYTLSDFSKLLLNLERSVINKKIPVTIETI